MVEGYGTTQLCCNLPICGVRIESNDTKRAMKCISATLSAKLVYAPWMTLWILHFCLKIGPLATAGPTRDRPQGHHLGSERQRILLYLSYNGLLSDISEGKYNHKQHSYNTKRQGNPYERTRGCCGQTNLCYSALCCIKVLFLSYPFQHVHMGLFFADAPRGSTATMGLHDNDVSRQDE